MVSVEKAASEASDKVESDKSYSEVEEAIGKPIMDAAQEEGEIE